MCLNSIQVPSHPHQGLEICVSPPPGALIHASFPSMWLLTSIQILMFVSHLHPCDVSPQSRPPKLHPHNPIKDSRYVSHLHPCPVSSGCGSKDFSLTSIHVLPQPNPGPYSHITPPSRQCLNSIQVLIFMCHLNPGHVSPPPRSGDVWYTSIDALSHLQPCHSPRLRFTSTHLLISACHHHPSDVSPSSSS